MQADQTDIHIREGQELEEVTKNPRPQWFYTHFFSQIRVLIQFKRGWGSYNSLTKACFQEGDF